MKKALMYFLLIGLVVTLAGCGVKNSLERSNPGYPRNYPVY